MKNTGGKHKDIPRHGRHRLQSYLNGTHSLLDKNQFHAVLPMQSHLREILWDGAGINVKGEPLFAVALILLQ